MNGAAGAGAAVAGAVVVGAGEVVATSAAEEVIPVAVALAEGTPPVAAERVPNLLLDIEDALYIVAQQSDLQSLGRISCVCKKLGQEDRISLIKTCTQEIHNELLVSKEEARQLVSLAQKSLEATGSNEWDIDFIKQKVTEIQVNAIVEKIEDTVELASSLRVGGREKLIEKLNRLHVADLKRLGTDEGLFDDFKAVISVDVIAQIGDVNNDLSLSLDLSNKDLTKGKFLRVIMEIDNPAKLKRLVLIGNQLTTLPESIGSLGELNHLDLRGNQLTVLPESIDRLAKLQVLVLTSNQLTVLPESISRLAELLNLHLNDNQLTALPENIGALVNLKGLNLTGNQLPALPECIGRFAELELLDLTGNGLTDLPESIGSLAKLVQLVLTGNQLTALPESIGTLVNLKGLNLTGNDLTDLPESIGELTKLFSLVLNGNQLTALPESIGALVNLKRLNLPMNQLAPVEQAKIRDLLPDCNVVF